MPLHTLYNVDENYFQYGYWDYIIKKKKKLFMLYILCTMNDL